MRGECRALRLVRPDWMKVELVPPRPSSQAFQDRPESQAMSVYLADDIVAAGRSIDELQKLWEGYWIFSLTINQLRDDFGQEVIRDPQANFPGHALVRDPSGKRSAGKRSRMAANCILALQPSNESSSDTPPALLPKQEASKAKSVRRWWRFWRR
jgi:hypothetical protein